MTDRHTGPVIAETEDLREFLQESAGGVPRPEAELEAARSTANLAASVLLNPHGVGQPEFL
jgi:hypothetical protein